MAPGKYFGMLKPKPVVELKHDNLTASSLDLNDALQRQIDQSPQKLGSSQAHTQFKYHHFSQDKTALILSACKKAGRNINDLLAGALLKTVAADLCGDDEQYVAISSAINVRPLLPEAYKNAVGYFSAATLSRVLLSKSSDLLTLGSQVTRDTRAQFDAITVRFGLWLKRALLRLKPDPQHLIDTVHRNYKSNVHLSNMGRLGLRTRYGDLELSRVLVIVNVHYTQKPIFCLLSVAHNKELTLVGSFCQPHTGQVRAERLFRAYIDQIEDFIAAVKS